MTCTPALADTYIQFALETMSAAAGAVKMCNSCNNDSHGFSNNCPSVLIAGDACCSMHMNVLQPQQGDTSSS